MTIQLGEMMIGFIKGLSDGSSDVGVAFLIFVLLIFPIYAFRKFRMNQEELMKVKDSTEELSWLRKRSSQYFNTALLILGLIVTTISFSYGKELSLDVAMPLFGASATSLISSLYVSRLGFLKRKEAKPFIQFQFIELSILLMTVGFAKLLQNQFPFSSNLLYSLAYLLVGYYMVYAFFSSIIREYKEGGFDSFREFLKERTTLDDKLVDYIGNKWDNWKEN